MNELTQRFSRQIGALGASSMTQLSRLKILVIGLETIGQECVKCLALMGVSSFVLHDPTGSNRKYANRLINYETSKSTTLASYAAELINTLYPSASVEILQKLTQGSMVDLVQGDQKPDVIVYTNEKLYPLLTLEKVCKEYQIRYILAFNHSLLGYLFVNFHEHAIQDPDGEPNQSSFVHQFQEDKGQVTLTLYEPIHVYRVRIVNERGDQYEGPVLRCDQTTIRMMNDDALLQVLHASHVRVIQIKAAEQVTYRCLADRFSDKHVLPHYVTLSSSFAACDVALYSSYVEYLMKPTKLPENLLGFYLDSRFHPLSVILGGLAAQEVIKVTGKHTPLQPDLFVNYTAIHFSGIRQTKNDGYDNNVILGPDIPIQFASQYVTLVGGGALGCELFKNLCMMGFCKSRHSMLSVIDMDTVSLSNLSRQFLFQTADIGKFKSEVIKQKAKALFPSVQVKSYMYEMGSAQETVYTDTFWRNSSFVVNALDNIDARKYVDSRCLLHDKRLFESGTLGTKGNVQTIIPKISATYSETRDSEIPQIPFCTIRSFPSQMSHCVEWGLDCFDEAFTKSFDDVRSFLSHGAEFLNQLEYELADQPFVLRTRLDWIHIWIEWAVYPKKFPSIALMHRIWNKWYVTPIQSTLQTHPLDSTDSDGQLFWSGKRLPPKLVPFGTHAIFWCKAFLQFIRVNILPITGIDITETALSVYGKTDKYQEIEVEEAQNTVQIQIDEAKDTISYHVDEDKTSNLKQMILNLVKDESFDKQLLTWQSVPYEKDDDTHANWMAALVNERAKQYGISTEDTLSIQLMSGRIIPALATTTTVIAGLVMVEIVKSFANKKPSDVNVNLALNQWLVFDSQRPQFLYSGMFSNLLGTIVKTVPETYTTWTKIEIDARKDSCYDVQSLVNILESEHSITPDRIWIHQRQLYNNKIGPKHKDYKAMMSAQLESHFAVLGLRTTQVVQLGIYWWDEEGVPIMTPPIYFSLHSSI